MKVLFLDHPEADYLAAILFIGLCQELGADNVVDYPPKPSYHGQVHRYPACYPVGSVGVQQEGVEGVTAPFAWMPDVSKDEPPWAKALPWTRADVIAGLQRHHFDLLIVASPRRRALEAFADLRDAVGRWQMPTTVLIDGEDYADIRTDAIALTQPHLYFKRELSFTGHAAGVRVLPCPFASPLEARPPVEKTVDVMFLGGATWPGRQAVAEVLQREFGQRAVVGGSHGFEEYISLLQRSKVAVSMRGHGYDTLRFWEIPSFDTLMIADRLPIHKPDPFLDEIHCLYFGDAGELIQRVRKALAEPEWASRIARTGNAHLRAKHTARARVLYILKESVGYTGG